MGLGSGIWRGAVAGAAGTCALNATTYLDMALRGRPSSSTPEQTVEQVAQKAGLTIPGEGEQRADRVQGLGALTGILAGVGVGAALGGVRGIGGPTGFPGTAAAAFGLGMVAGNGPMTVLGITDPRDWDLTSWLSDVAPHIAYAVVAAVALTHLD